MDQGRAEIVAPGIPCLWRRVVFAAAFGWDNFSKQQTNKTCPFPHHRSFHRQSLSSIYSTLVRSLAHLQPLAKMRFVSALLVFAAGALAQSTCNAQVYRLP
jgi:hypothetical protein